MLKYVEQDNGKVLSDLLRQTISNCIKVKKKVKPFKYWANRKKCPTKD